MKCPTCKQEVKIKETYKCCLCKKTGGDEFYFHHFTPKMKHRYQCIYCRFDNNPVTIAKVRAEHKVFVKQMKFMEKLTKQCAKN